MLSVSRWVVPRNGSEDCSFVQTGMRQNFIKKIKNKGSTDFLRAADFFILLVHQ